MIRRLIWFGHVKKGDECEALMSVSGVEVLGEGPPGRLKNTCRIAAEHLIGIARGRSLIKDEYYYEK